MSSNAGVLGWLKVFARGGVLNMLPIVVKAFVNETLRIQQVDSAKATEWVKNGERLLSHVSIEDNEAVRNIIGGLGIDELGLDQWLTADWLLEAIRQEHPRVYSLMMGWPAGYAWCDKQVQEIRAEIEKVVKKAE